MQKLTFLPKKGNTFGICASLSEDYICCGTHVLRTISNCPFDCTYCFLQNYLTDKTPHVISDLKNVVQEVQEMISAQPWKFFRIGTWELGDSLAFEDETKQAQELISYFKDFKQCLLELKTKSGNVQSILKLEHNGRVVVSWSLNPENIVATEEKGTASLEERLAAMQKVIAKGYLTAFHFDPMIWHDNWQKNYEELIQKIAQKIPPQKVAWISIGSLRFNPEMKSIVEELHPESKITSAEMILGPDRKKRYVKPIRLEMYRHLFQLLKKLGFSDVFTYLCMERKDMWQKVFGFAPDSNNHQSYLFTKSLFKRFPGLIHQEPDYQAYTF